MSFCSWRGTKSVLDNAFSTSRVSHPCHLCQQWRDKWRKTGSIENRGKKPLELLTFCSCLKSWSCSTENQSIWVLISNQKSVMASAVIVYVHVWEVISQLAQCGYCSSLCRFNATSALVLVINLKMETLWQNKVWKKMHHHGPFRLCCLHFHHQTAILLG